MNTIFFIQFYKTIFNFVINSFSYIIACFIVKPFSEPADTRSAFEILFTPFVNWFRKFKECFTLIRKDSLINSLLNFYKLYLSFLIACIFFIMYFTAYTYIGLIIYGTVPMLLMCVGSAINAYIYINPEGPLTAEAYNAIIVFRYLVFIFGLISSSCIIISTCAKISFLRVILIDTVGSLSYKFYVGENPGSKAGLLWNLAPRIVGAVFVCTAGMAGIDAIVSEKQLNHLHDLCAKDGQIMTVAQKMGK
jgi:hypothetical protein